MVSQTLDEQPQILVVEDNIDSLLYVTAALNLLGYSFATAQYAQPALYLARKNLPALILLDIGLPKRSGLDLVRDLKRDHSTKDIPIVIISAIEISEIEKQAKVLGCDEYLEKPYLFEQLERKINSLIN
ncbi:response regulator [Pleurocapsa sp. PCC 7319]|uniref:response regulator n=1 Tax=Pleurocapsa sp. PCC 7319 TaxID=118161 RepID=UPI00034C968B|nr:response regulator [Pleurocapsa sp. PCC 7319]